MLARFWSAVAALLMAACGGVIDLTPQPFTRERADGKIPVKAELIRQQVRRELGGMPEGEAEVRRWQAIEADYHACRLSSKKAADAAEEVFADCMANRGYVYMHRFDAEQLHNDIAFEMEKDPDKWLAAVVTATIAASPITITSAPPPVTVATSESGGYSKYLLGIAAAGGIVAAVAGGGGGGDNSAPAPNPFPTVTMTSLPPSPMTMTMTPPRPSGYDINAPELGAWDIRDSDGSFWFLVGRIPIQGLSFNVRNIGAGDRVITLHRQDVTRTNTHGRQLQVLTLAIITQTGFNFAWQNDDIVMESFLAGGQGQVFMTTRPDIMRLDQLCGAPWLDSYLNNHFPGTNCPAMNRLSYSPDMRRVIGAAMADGFNPGIAIGESGFAFSGRYDGDNRAAGFIYDFGNFALRTDYIRLPAKQDSAVWLDAYRFGALSRINDEVRLYAGVDSYNNAIFAIDAQSDNAHRLGFAVGDGYAVKYEYRLNL